MIIAPPKLSKAKSTERWITVLRDFRDKPRTRKPSASSFGASGLTPETDLLLVLATQNVLRCRWGANQKEDL